MVVQVDFRMFFLPYCVVLQLKKFFCSLKCFRLLLFGRAESECLVSAQSEPAQTTPEPLDRGGTRGKGP